MEIKSQTFPINFRLWNFFFLEEKSGLVKYWKSSLNFHFEFLLDLAGYDSEVAGEGPHYDLTGDLCLSLSQIARSS